MKINEPGTIRSVINKLHPTKSSKKVLIRLLRLLRRVKMETGMSVLRQIFFLILVTKRKKIIRIFYLFISNV